MLINERTTTGECPPPPPPVAPPFSTPISAKACRFFSVLIFLGAAAAPFVLSLNLEAGLTIFGRGAMTAVFFWALGDIVEAVVKLSER
jgi:hypothetical protein